VQEPGDDDDGDEATHYYDYDGGRTLSYTYNDVRSRSCNLGGGDLKVRGSPACTSGSSSYEDHR
jgi:hypothetical protein